jgi:hypothetical protein
MRDTTPPVNHHLPRQPTGHGTGQDASLTDQINHTMPDLNHHPADPSNTRPLHSSQWGSVRSLTKQERFLCRTSLYIGDRIAESSDRISSGIPISTL